MRAIFFFFNDTATTEIYTLSLTTLFRSVRVPRDAGRAGATVEIGGTTMRRWPRPRCAHRHERDRRTVYRGPRVGLPAGFDRKSTRLNSSHSQISNPAFCLKAKTSVIVDE